MKPASNIWYLSSFLTFSICFLCCSQPAKKDDLDKKEQKVIKQNSPLDEQKKQKSKAMMDEIYKHLNFITETDGFMNIINHSRNNHLFVNADHQGYIIAVVKDKGFKTIPEGERAKLLDTSDANKSYQLKFLIHHVIPSPNKTYPGQVYMSLGGEEISLSEDRSNLRLKNRSYRIGSSIKVLENLEIITLDSVLYY
jgi:hypothetical protein